LNGAEAFVSSEIPSLDRWQLALKFAFRFRGGSRER
jgi:hypothetical protein